MSEAELGVEGITGCSTSQSRNDASVLSPSALTTDLDWIGLEPMQVYPTYDDLPDTLDLGLDPIFGLETWPDIAAGDAMVEGSPQGQQAIESQPGKSPPQGAR